MDASSSSPVAAPFLATRLRQPRTMFILLDSGTGIRNILRTDVFPLWKACPDLRMVIFSPLHDAEFRAEFESDRVAVEPLPQWKAGPLVGLFRSLHKDLWAEKHHVVRYRERRRQRKLRLFRSTLLRLLVGTGTGPELDRALARLQRWEYRFTPRLGTPYFEKYRPDLVFYTTLYLRNPCVEIGAAQRRIKGLAFILSWDNPTTKGPFPVRPDRAIVWNPIMQDELVTFHDFRREHVFISGPPQFDIYVDRSAYASRDEFFRKWSLDPAKRLITYTTGTAGMLPFEHEMVELLHQRIQAGALRQPCQLLVRLHPKDLYAPYQRFEGLPGLVIQMPGRRGKTNDSWNPTHGDMRDLAETMCHSDVVVNIASTITIDAAAFDKPVVNPAFDGHSVRPYAESCRRYYDFNHYRNIVKTGGVRVTETLDATLQAIQTYLDNPQLDAEGRARLRSEQCYQLDGCAGRRIAEYALRFMDEPGDSAAT